MMILFCGKNYVDRKFINVNNYNVFQDLHHLETAGELRSESQTGALSAGKADARGQQIQDSKHNRGDRGYDHDLLNIRDLAGDDDHRHRDGETLQEILDGTRQEFAGRETVHLSYIRGFDFFLGSALQSKDWNTWRIRNNVRS